MGAVLPRKRSVIVAGLNVRAHPHSPDIYRRLIEVAYRLRRALPVRGNDYLLLSHIDSSRVEKDGFISGQIAKFTNIDLKQPWFNTVEFDKADDQLVSKIMIPEGLRPNYKSIEFAFDLERHCLVFESYSYEGSLSASAALRFFSGLFSQKEVAAEFGKVQITIISDKDALALLLNNGSIHRLRIVIRRPNAPDDFGGLDELFESGLTEQRLERIELDLHRQPGEHIKPNAQTRAVADLARRNGEVFASVEEDGRVVTKSTEETPKTVAVGYDPVVTSGSSAFRKAARRFTASLHL